MGTAVGIRRAFAAAAVVALAAACAPGGEQAAPQDTPQPQESVDFTGETLTYLYFTDGPDEQATRDTIAAFEKETGAKVDLQIVPYADLEASLQARLSGGDAPDVVRLADLGPFREDLLDLAPFLGEDYGDQFIEGMVGAATTEDGGLIAVPSDLTMNGPFVNVDMFTKAGIELPADDDPWTWEELLAAAEKAQQASGSEFAFAMDKSGHRVSTILSQYGTRLITDGEESLDADKAAEAITLLTDLMASGKADKDFWLASGSKYKGANEIFLAQATPVYLSGNWQVSQFAQAAEFEWRAIPNPCAEECGGFPGGKYMAALAESDTPDLAAAFVEFANSAEHQAKFAATAQFLPTRNDLVEEGVDYAARSEDMATFLADVQRTPKEDYSTVSSPAFGASAKVLVDEISKVVAGQQDVATAVQNTKTATAQQVADLAP